MDHQATRAEIRQVNIGLAGVEQVLADISAGRVPDERRLALARAYQAALHRPILSSGDVPEGLRIPLLAEAYVNPGFRTAQVQMTERLAEEHWWNEHPVRDDLEGFFLGYLTAPQATEAPLLVLGQPGSGKSVLTQVLAARLPPSEFLALRVVLREVPADADLQAQIVLVTSRTAVADRARPVSGMVAMRLEPFRDSQIAQWLVVWNAANAPHLAARGLRPLPVESVLAHPELACQPLLLLMLGLYDADGNPLQREDAVLRQSELYERLLTQFAEREVRKAGAALSSAQFDQAVDWELLRLSVVAFAMFNRGRQWVPEAELHADLPALLGEPSTRQRSTSGLRAELTAAEVVIGRFFFIHEAQATRDSTRLKTYEFLHTTFGEYLIGRLVTWELNEDDAVAHALEPLADNFGTTITSFHDYHLQGRLVSAANALATLWLAASQQKSPDELAVAYDTCIRILITGFAPQDVDTRARFRAHVLRQLATDVHRLPASWLGDVIRQIKETGKSPDRDGPELVRMANEILPGPMAEDLPRPL